MVIRGASLGCECSAGQPGLIWHDILCQSKFVTPDRLYTNATMNSQSPTHEQHICRVKGALTIPPDFKSVIHGVNAFFERLALDPPGGLPPGLPAAPPPQEAQAGVQSDEQPLQEDKKRGDGPKAVAKPGASLASSLVIEERS